MRSTVLLAVDMEKVPGGSSSDLGFSGDVQAGYP
jgi:hypothetical protein